MTRQVFLRATLFGLFAVAVVWAQPAKDVASEMATSAKRLLGALDAEQQKTATIPFADEERYNFHYIPRARLGMSYKDMEPGQRKVGLSLLASGLSRRGMSQALDIMYLEQILFELEKHPRRDPDAYFFTIFGTPGESEDWGWRFEGHHLSLNFTLRDGRIVSAAPAFWGANPANVLDGPNKGMRVLESEEVLGRALLKSFENRDSVVIMAEAPRDIATTTDRRVKLGAPAGVSHADMNPAQKEALLALVSHYAQRMRQEIAESTLERIREAGVDNIHFAWAGGNEPGDAHYYRIHGPTFLIEYDNTQNNANHIHTVWRNLEADFGDVDLLSNHYAQSPHHQPAEVAGH
ncbi:MAG: DUF3500 domain-containing protein [Acidobacteria bacterium]|nr:MAG: DUF3500 domain-containing protein [Acidobacteriota bacterium]